MRAGRVQGWRVGRETVLIQYDTEEVLWRVEHWKDLELQHCFRLKNLAHARMVARTRYLELKHKGDRK